MSIVWCLFLLSVFVSWISVVVDLVDDRWFELLCWICVLIGIDVVLVMCVVKLGLKLGGMY